MVKNALRLFSEDRTGLADYALESGGQKQRLYYNPVIWSLSAEIGCNSVFLQSLMGKCR